MATPIKIRDMFLVPPGGGRVVLNPGAQYVMTRQGVVATAPELPALPELEDGRPEALRAYNTNALVALGSRGDLRQLEALYGNVTNLYNNSVLESDVVHSGSVVTTYTPDTFVQNCADGIVYDMGPHGARILSLSASAAPGSVAFYGEAANSPDGPWLNLTSGINEFYNGVFWGSSGTITASIGWRRSFRYVRFRRHLNWPAGGVVLTCANAVAVAGNSVAYDMGEPVVFTRVCAWGRDIAFAVHVANSPTGPWTSLSDGLTVDVHSGVFWEVSGDSKIDSVPMVSGAFRYVKRSSVIGLPEDFQLWYRRPLSQSYKFLTRAESARIAELIADPYNAHIFIEGGVPVGEDILTLMIPSPVNLPANLTGSYLHCGTKPSAAFAITLYKNATSLGTLTINTSGGFAASITATSFAKGDKLRLVPQTVGDATLADLAMTLHMKRG